MRNTDPLSFLIKRNCIRKTKQSKLKFNGLTRHKEKNDKNI